MPTRAVATEADLLARPGDGQKAELVDGEIRVSPAGFLHEAVVMRIARLLDRFVEERGLGWVLASSAGFRLPSGNVRSPDVSFVRRERVPPGPLPEGYLGLVPDLIVEVLSPFDRERDVADKIGEYFESGAGLVWLVDPRARSVTVFRSLTDVERRTERDELRGDEALPGFSCRVGELFP